MTLLARIGSYGSTLICEKPFLPSTGTRLPTVNTAIHDAKRRRLVPTIIMFSLQSYQTGKHLDWSSVPGSLKLMYSSRLLLPVPVVFYSTNTCTSKTVLPGAPTGTSFNLVYVWAAQWNMHTIQTLILLTQRQDVRAGWPSPQSFLPGCAPAAWTRAAAGVVHAVALVA